MKLTEKLSAQPAHRHLAHCPILWPWIWQDNKDWWELWFYHPTIRTYTHCEPTPLLDQRKTPATWDGYPCCGPDTISPTSVAHSKGPASWQLKPLLNHNRVSEAVIQQEDKVTVLFNIWSCIISKTTGLRTTVSHSTCEFRHVLCKFVCIISGLAGIGTVTLLTCLLCDAVACSPGQVFLQDSKVYLTWPYQTWLLKKH